MTGDIQHRDDSNCEGCDYREQEHATTAAMFLCAFSGFLVGCLVCWSFL